MSTRTKRGLGRGLEALLSEDVSAGAHDQIFDLPIDELKSGAHQPRRSIDEDALESLTQSIKSQGIVQPLVVRAADDGYEIVAGERRWRAARRAGLAQVPAVVRTIDDETAAAVALIENIQRENLDAVEESDGLARLINEFGMTHAQCAQSVGRSRASVSNLLRLADLAEPVRDHLRAGHMNMGHARALLGLGVEDQTEAASEVVARGLTVRQTEALVRDWPVSGQSSQSGQASELHGLEDATSEEQTLAAELAESLAMPVRLKANRRGGGHLTIRFADRDQLSALAARLSEKSR